MFLMRSAHNSKGRVLGIGPMVAPTPENDNIEEAAMETFPLGPTVPGTLAHLRIPI